MFKFFKIIIFCLYFVLPIGVSADDSIYQLPVAKNEIKIMFFNIENLFDAEHDENKKDYEFLPATHKEKKNCKTTRNADVCHRMDWTKEKVALKIQQIKKAVAAQGVLPDVLGLVEVENSKVVGELAKALGYTAYEVTDSPDQRGIDCAILYKKEKLNFVEFVEKEIEKAIFPTRNISAAVFQTTKSLGSKNIIVSVNHWPSQGNSSDMRLTVARQTVQLLESMQNKYVKNDPHFVVIGDFNTLPDESPNAITDELLNKGSRIRLYDTHALAKEQNSPFLKLMPPGTYYYGREDNWNEFDHIFISDNLKDKKELEVDAQTFRILAPKFMTIPNKKGEPTPFRYNHSTNNVDQLGYSDHFALVVKLRY